MDDSPQKPSTWKLWLALFGLILLSLIGSVLANTLTQETQNLEPMITPSYILNTRTPTLRPSDSPSATPTLTDN